MTGNLTGIQSVEVYNDNLKHKLSEMLHRKVAWHFSKSLKETSPWGFNFYKVAGLYIVNSPPLKMFSCEFN